MTPTPPMGRDELARWAQDAFVELRQLLYWRWDPIGVSDSFPITAGEYDRYAQVLVGRLRQGMTPEEIAGYLGEVEQTWIGMGTGEVARRAVGELVADWYENSLGVWGTADNEVHRGRGVHDQRGGLEEEVRRFCDLIEHPGLYAREQFVSVVWWSLVGVLASAARLPAGEASDAPEARHPSHAEWRKRLSELERILGDWRYYHSTGAAYGDDARESDVRNLADDLADIWGDLKPGLVALEDGSATVSGARWLWSSSFISHWGRHAVEGVRALQNLMDAGRPDPVASESEQAREIELIPDGDHWRVPLRGTVEQVGIDYSVTLSVSQYRPRESGPAVLDVGWTLRIGQPFQLRRPGLADHTVVPGEDYPALGPALAVTNQEVTALSVWNDGRLRIEFSGGEVITVDADKHYEAWQLYAGNHSLISPIAPDLLRPLARGQ